MGRPASRAEGRSLVLAATAAVAALALVALTTMGAKTSGSQPSMLQQQQQQQQLYQIGDQEFLGMNTGSVGDMSQDIEKIMANEKILLKRIVKKVHEHQRVHIDVVAGQLGPKGPPGPPGYPGIRGYPGSPGRRGRRGGPGGRGPQGHKGKKGPKGIDGKQGAHGDKGNTGPNGPPGPRGRRGRIGPRGAEGAMGKSGGQGEKGENGKMGPQGPPAGRAPRGVPGPQGPQGLPGRNGDHGAQGDRGATGTRGVAGADGAAGLAGAPGKPGKSVCGMRSNTGQNLCCGAVMGKSFKKIGWQKFQVDVDTSHCGFSGEPRYFTSLENKGYGDNALTVENIENPTGTKNRMNPDKFRVILKGAGVNSVRRARRWKYKMNWCGFGNSEKKPSHYAVCCGSTKRGKWTRVNSYWAQLKVDTSGCGWKNSKDSRRKAAEAPMYFTSMTDSTCGKGIMSSGQCAAKARGFDSPRKPHQTGFEIRVNALPGESRVNRRKANQNGWQINWCAIKALPPTSDGRPGYPCTAARIMNVDGSKRVMTNQGSMCCGDTTSHGWKSAGDGKTIVKEVDIGACKFNKISYTLTDLRGDKGTLQHLRGASSYVHKGSSANKLLVYVYTGGRYKAWKAPGSHWKVQWCTFGR